MLPTSSCSWGTSWSSSQPTPNTERAHSVSVIGLGARAAVSMWCVCARGGGCGSSSISAKQALPSLGRGMSAKLTESRSGTSLFYWVSEKPPQALLHFTLHMWKWK